MASTTLLRCRFCGRYVTVTVTASAPDPLGRLTVVTNARPVDDHEYQNHSTQLVRALQEEAHREQ